MFDVIIIGGGAAGLTAALNLLRNGYKTLIIERETVGGQIVNSPRVENIPGIKEISGQEFIDQFMTQVMDAGCEFEFDSVESVSKEDGRFIVKCQYASYEAKKVVIACGVTHNTLPVDGISLPGVSYCALCDGAFYKDQNTVVVGDANTALTYALLLSKTSSHVDMICLFDKLFGEKCNIEKVMTSPKITLHFNKSVTRVLGSEKAEGVEFKDTKDGNIESVNAPGIFICVGNHPETDIFASLVDRENGYILVNSSMQTKTEGLYAIGDCTSKSVRQLTTAFSDAAIAALYITKELS